MDRWLPKGAPPPPQSDGAFERFLTAAIATIITIMFSWRLLDKINDEDREDELAEEERRRRLGLSTFLSSPKTTAAPTFGGEGAARNKTPDITPTTQLYSAGKLDALNQRVLALTENMGRGRLSSGIGYQTTTLKPVIRIPVDLPLDGEEEEETGGESPNESIYRPVWGNTIHPQARSQREGIPVKLESKHAGECFDQRADRYEVDRQHDSSFESNTVTDGTASSTETLLVHSQLDSEPEHSSSETDQFVDSSAEELGGDGQHSHYQHRQLQLNVSTDSSSGGANSSKEEYRNILDDDNYQPYTDSYRDGEDKYSDRDSDEEFLGISDGLDTDYAHDDIQPRELDSDEELFCCSVLEPIIEEDSDEITTSSDSTNSSRSGKACYESRHREHEYDLEYEERKHGLISDRGQYQIRSRGLDEHDSVRLSSSLSSGVSNQQHVLLGSRPSTAVPSPRRPPASPHLPGRTRDLESSRLNDVNTASATGPDDQGDTGRGGDDGVRTHTLGEERYYGGIDERLSVSQPPFQETDLDASDSFEDNTNFPSEEDYVKYIRSYGSSVDRLTGKLNRPVRRDNLGPFPHSQPPIDSVSEGITDTTKRTFPASLTGHHADQVVPDKFTRTLTEDSNSESDESAQTVITRQTSADSGDSPVHGPTLLTLRPGPVKTKRPLSDGFAYANKKLKGEEDKEEAYFRDRYVSEGGAPAFGEEGREQDDEDDYGREDNNNKYDLRAYKSYAALDSAGLSSPEHARKVPAHSTVLTLSGAKWDIPEIRDENSPSARDSNEDREFDQQEESTSTVTIDSEETFLPCDSVDNQNVPSDELKHPGDFKFVYSQFSREDNNDSEIMDTNEYWSAMADESLGSRTREHEDSEEWEERIVEETFVVPMTPERAILRTLQSVKELLDKRSEIRRHRALGLNVEETSEGLDDECQSTCTSTMIEVDGYGAAGFETYDAVEEDFPEQSDALVSRPLTNVDIKSKLGFHLNLDEYKTDEYSTESGWPIVRLIEKERVYIDEDGHDEHQVAVTIVDSGEQKLRDVHSDEEMETNIDDVEDSHDDEEGSRQNDADESDDESEEDDEEEEEGETDEESDEEKSESTNSDDDKEIDNKKKEEKFAFVECKDEKLVAPFASLETPVLDKRTHSQRTYLEQEGFAKLDFGDTKSPTVTQRSKPDFKTPESASTPDSYTPVVRAEMRAMSPPPIEIFTPKQQHSEVLFSPARKSTPPSYDISKHSSSSTISVSKTVQSHSISGFETEPKKLIDFDQPCDPFDDFNTFLSGIPAASESAIEEDYDSFVRHIAEKDEAVEILEQDSLKTPLSAAGILSGNLASPYKKQDVFSFPSKEQVRPVPLARKHSLRDKKPEVKEEETEVTGESDVKKAKLKRTSTAQSEEDFGLARRSSVGDEESTGVMNRSFEESSSYSFALERYDSEPGVSRSLSRESLLRTTSREGLESPTQDMRLLAETPTRHFVPSRPLSGVSLEPALDVVLEVPIPPQDSFRTGSSSSAEPTTPATPSSVAHVESSPVVISLPVAPLPTVSKTPSSSTATEKLLATPTKLEPSPVVSPPPPPTISKTPTKTVTEKAATPTKLETSPVVTTPPPPTISKTPTKPITETSAAAPNKPEPSPVVTPPPVKWTRVIPGSSFVDEKLSPNSGVNIAEEVQKKLPDTPERKLITTMTSPELERPDLMELEFADAEEDGPELFSPSLSIDRMEIKIEESPKIRPVLENNVLKFSVVKKSEAADSQKSEESEETEESESEYSDESDTSEEYEEEEEEELVSDKVSEENKTNVDNNDNLVREKQDKEKEAVVERRQEESLQVEHLSHSIDSVDSTMPQDTTSASVATSPGTLSSDSAATRSMTLPLTAPFRGMAWAHSQFGQAPAKPRTMKEIKKKFKPYKSVLTQGPPPTTPTTPPSPKITPFVLPEHLLTPSRLKIIQSRNRFLSEQNLNGDEFSGEFEARKEALMQNAAAPSETAPSTPAKERKYTPKNLSTSSKYRSQEQLEKIMNMINLTRKSESNLHTAHTKCLHSDCIFTEKGRRDIMDKALSIDNIHSDLYSQLQKLNAKDYLDSRGMGDAFFPETNSDLFDLTFPFQDDRRQVLDRPASMSELRHASDYTTISGSGGGLFDTPTSRSGKNRFANRQYKKSKSLCTLETNIDDDHFASSPTDDNLQRVPSVHELRISKSLQKLNVPNWYKQSSLSKSGSCLLKYGSSSTMSSWQMSPSLISSPCTTPSAMSNVVIKTRVQPPTSARNLRSPRYPSKSAPTTPSFANQSFENGSKPTTPTPVKLPSEQLRSKEKPKSLMPIPIVPFDKIRAMFEKKKEEAPPPKRGESPSSPTSPVPKPQVQESLPSPKKIGINGNAEEDELYDDVVPKVIVSPTDPNVKSILKRPGQEKRYSDIVESPEPEEEPIILRPVPTRPSEAAPTLTLPSAPVIMKPPEVVLVKEEEPVIKPPSETPKATLEDKPVIRQKPIPPPRPKSSEIKPITEVPVKKPEEVKDIQKSQTKPVDVKDPTPPTKPKGFSFFKSLRSSSSSSSEDVKTRKSPISPSKNLSPDSSYESDKFPASPAIRISPTDRKSPPSINVSTVPVTKEEPKPTILDKPSSAPVLPKAEMQRTRSPDLIQETNIDDSFEDPPSPRHETAPERTQSPPQSPPPQVSEPEKKRSWFAKPKLSKSKSPTEVEKSLPKPKLKVSELQSKFEVPEFAQEPRRLTSSRTSSVHNESFASNESEGREDKTRSPVVQPDYSTANVQLRSPVKETDLDSSIQSNSSRPSIRSRDLGVDYSRIQRKPSDSDSSFARDSEKRDSDRSREEKPVTRELDMEKDSSFSSRDEDRHNDSSDKDYDRDYDRESDRRDRDYDRRDVDRRDRDYDRRDVDRRDRDYDKRDVDRRDRDFDRRDVDRRDRDYDRRDVDRRDRDYDRRDVDRIDRDYDRRESNRRDRDNDRRESDRRDRDNDRRDRDYHRSDMDYDRRDVSSRDRDYDKRDRDNDRRDRNSVIRDRDGERSQRNSDSLDRRRPERQEPSRDRHQDFDTSRASSRDMDTSRDSRTGLRRPSDNDDTPKLRVGQSQESLRSAGRTWQPKPRGSRSSVSPQARDISPTKPVDSNGTSSKPSPYRYPVAGSAFSASKPNTAAGLNTPPLSRHDGKSQSSPTEAGKSLKETTV